MDAAELFTDLYPDAYSRFIREVSAFHQRAAGQPRVFGARKTGDGK